jgi:hypothetical protein
MVLMMMRLAVDRSITKPKNQSFLGYFLLVQGFVSKIPVLVKLPGRDRIPCPTHNNNNTLSVKKVKKRPVCWPVLPPPFNKNKTKQKRKNLVWIETEKRI